ncbi:transcription elongation factor GreAB [Paraburkholderia acidicola]|uniref:Transcription elongation factor GreAB n=1 Tax=Paraburkholderia acidicola TaxID=1912599 RepID=A0A2A4ENL2_9BURK|nr:glycosyltransferase family 1 protein [Paraburkholderia acidicola]PCE21884.1 transcription elongation factor GreAB [Paraburkholderia acidicola]
MKVVLAVDAIRPPLTGIGRYTWELATHFHRSTELDNLRLLFGSRWIDDPASLLLPQPRQRKPRWLFDPGWLRRRRVRSGLRGHLFHSPNYFLPPEVDEGIVTVHDLSVFKYPETHPDERLRYFDTHFASTLRRARHLITDSFATRDEVVDYFDWPGTGISVVGLGVSPEFHPRSHADLLAPLRTYGLTPDRYALCVSTLEPRKRIDRLLAAYRDLPAATKKQYPLVLAGSHGWLNQNLLTTIEHGVQEGWLHHLGFVPDTLLPALYAGAHAFLFPSVYEGYGLPLLEALASGIPSLTSNRSSLPEVAEGAAWLIEPDDHELLKTGIAQVLYDDAWREQARTRGLAVAAKRSWADCAARTLDVYRQMSALSCTSIVTVTS